ncbi:Protein Shroom1 [Oryzias melastigma]|uniref:Protein Shroom1 n=1 Tax=Oryzias melastigma TaxID=30732 RepID=A0A834C4E3_ORYME|nr:Protein Shroom1 [Oryzias melastigma]
MDSYSLHFERMSNVDLHPLSLPVSRLSPAKSNSSIIEQLAHHQHGKGDSAYSSFSGGSTAPDYPSPFLPDELHSSSFSHYADLGCVKSFYRPAQILHSESKTMDQLYRSVEAISQQYHNSTNINHQSDNSNNNLHSNNKALSTQQTHSRNPSQGGHPHADPPPIPTRLDSYIATKNLENTRVHHSTELQPQQPKPQQNSRSHSLPRGLPPKVETSNQENNSPSFNCDPVWRALKQQQPQAQHPPSHRSHLQHFEETRMTPEDLFITESKAATEQQRLGNILSRSPPCNNNQPNHLTPRQSLSSDGYNSENHNKPSGYSGRHRRRAHSAQDQPVLDPTRPASTWSAGQNLISSSIQHKGQFYFVTGVCKMSESGLRMHSASTSGAEAGRDISVLLERCQHRDKERSHSTLDNMFRPFQDSSCSSIPEKREAFTPGSRKKDLTSKSLDQDNPRQTHLSQSPPSFDSLEDTDVIHSQEIGRHTLDSPIFYCGPDRKCPPLSAAPQKEFSTLFSIEKPNHNNREDPAKKERGQTLGDAVSEKINKDTTPLLYHLTGANLSVLQAKNEPDFSTKDHGDIRVNDGRPPQHDAVMTDRGGVSSVACNTLDDSFKKYYKEKLKDAQCKVLRETSFTRRDLQLSLPNQTRQKPELRPATIHSFSSSQDSETSTDTLTPSVTSDETERGSIKEISSENLKMTERDFEKANGRPTHVAQPQVARIGGRKRLTPEQKKMCYSEPEKLNQLEGAPKHAVCRSFGNESDSPFTPEYEEEERVHQGDRGLVALRRKMFEPRGRAMSASGASQTNLKHFRHKALVEYMERKTGYIITEPQQPVAQLPPQPRQRHSLGEKPSDWAIRSTSENHESKNSKKKHRPHSAGRILDCPQSSMRYAQFLPAQSCSGQYAGRQNPSRQRQSRGPAQAKSASAESLLDQQESAGFGRNRSTSTPHAFQVHDYAEDPLPVGSMETRSSQKNAAEESPVKPLSEGPLPVRVVAQRGKSMEELGTSKITELCAMSKSSEHLDQLRRSSNGPGGPGRDEAMASHCGHGKEAQWQERGRSQAGKEPEFVCQKNSQEQIQNQTQKKPLSQQSSVEDSLAEEKSSSRSNTPPSTSSSHVRAHSACLGPHGPVSDGLRSGKESILPFRGLDSEMQIKSTVSQTDPSENPSCSSKEKTTSGLSRPEKEQNVDEGSSDTPPPESNHEVPLSCGVTTDPSLWILPPNEESTEEVQTPLEDSVFDEFPSSDPMKQTSETSVPVCSPVSDADLSQQAEEQKHPEMEEKMEERGTPEEETEGPEKPNEKPQWQELVEAVVKADQSLARVLYPLANRKTALMLMEQVMSEDTLLMEEHYKRKQEQRGTAESTEVVEGLEKSPSASASDIQESPPADLLWNNKIIQMKHLLVSYIEEHLHSLEECRCALQLEVQENAAHGKALEVLVQEHCLPVELERYNLFIGDLERVMNLLLCLSARLARVQNALSNVDENTDAEEKECLDSRHRLLCKQRDDAKDLKDNLDRRENLVSTFLSRQLSEEQVLDYRRFVQTKASLLIRQKDLEEKQRLGEEQLEALSNSLKL